MQTVLRLNHALSTRSGSTRHALGGTLRGFGTIASEVTPSILYQPSNESPKVVNVISAPMTFGQPYNGTDFGPSLLLQKGFLPALSALSWRVENAAPLEFGLSPSSAASNDVSLSDLQSKGMQMVLV